MRGSERTLPFALMLMVSCGASPPPRTEAPLVAVRVPLDRGALDRVAMFASTRGLCVLVDGVASCWLEEGFHSSGPREWEGPFALQGGPYVDLDATGYRVCGCAASGETRCWGPTTDCRESTWTTHGRISTIDAPQCRAVTSECVLGQDDVVWCWGGVVPTMTVSEGGQRPREGPFAQRGDSRSAEERCPEHTGTVITSLGPVEALYGGVSGDCAVDVDVEGHRALRCWGWNVHGQLSNGPLTDGLVRVPLDVVPEQVVLESWGACATTSTEVICWGGLPLASSAEEEACQAAVAALDLGWCGNAYFDLPILPPACTLPPRALPGAGHMRDVAISASGVCGVDDEGRLVCWGDHHTQDAPHVRADHVVSVELDQGGCVLTDTAEIWCWGLMSLIGTDSWYGAAHLLPGRRMARVTSEGLERCDADAEVDPCGPQLYEPTPRP